MTRCSSPLASANAVAGHWAASRVASAIANRLSMILGRGRLLHFGLWVGGHSMFFQVWRVMTSRMASTVWLNSMDNE